MSAWEGGKGSVMRPTNQKKYEDNYNSIFNTGKGEDMVGTVQEWDKLAGKQQALDKQEGGDHYKGMAIQPVEYIVSNNLDFLQGNVVKYVSRHKVKNGAEDIRKAIHCLELILEKEYSKS
jgi:hypothetical protein